MRFAALDHYCPRCGAKPHRACRKLNNIGPTHFLRVPHVERRDISNETASGSQRRPKYRPSAPAGGALPATVDATPIPPAGLSTPGGPS
jgi:hypothetical protein